MPWFKSKDDANALTIMAALQDAVEHVHPDRFVSPLDQMGVCQPELVTLNRLLGKADSERFTPASYEHVIARVQLYEERGLIDQVRAAAADSAVLMALIMATTHESHLAKTGDSHNERNRGGEIQTQARLIIDCLNLGSEQPF